jgi:hypothetical protein
MPQVSLDVSQKTDAVALPVGTTGQRPASLSGEMRYNSTSSSIESYQGLSPMWGHRRIFPKSYAKDLRRAQTQRAPDDPASRLLSESSIKI